MNVNIDISIHIDINVKITINIDIENVEKAELKTSLSLIDDVTSLEQIAEALRPRIEFSHWNCSILIGFLCVDEFIL